MYKVLIVDDEPVICEGLKRSVPWDRYQCEVVGTAEDGLEGLEKMRELRPDILFSDIAMNNMDGLAMVAAIRSEYPDTQVCLLTGYRNFEYAQRAITLGVTRFLLKPSRMSEIEEAISAMTQRLGASRDTQTDVVDSLWDMQKEEERYLYETFLKECPDSEDPRESAAGRSRNMGANGYVVKSALVYMLANYRSKLTLTDVADHCFVSSWHLSRLLNQYTGRGFFEIINQIRVDEAKQLLTGTADRVSDIAEAVGFLDVAHFSRIFKTFTKVSPKEYRSGQKPLSLDK